MLVAMSHVPAFRWARRVQPDLIRRLYALDAKGVQDDELVNEVGYAIYARCESIRIATEAHAGRATCRQCRAEMRHRWARNEPLVCESCGWTTTWGDYLKSYQRKQLHGGSGYLNFLAFLDRWPKARAYRDKLLAIDWLMHQCHSTAAFPLGRPIAVNLIEGNAHEVAAFLDELAYGAKSTPGLESTRDAWRAGAGRRWTRDSAPKRAEEGA